MGITTLLDAMVILPDAQLLVAGHGSQEANLKRYAGGVGVDARVRFIGRVTDDTLIDLYSAADAVVVPSAGLEGFGLIVLEAMACGTPVVASNIGGLVEAMGPFSGQWTVPPCSPDKLASAMRRIIHSGPSHEDVREYALANSSVCSAARLETVLGDDQPYLTAKPPEVRWLA